MKTIRVCILALVVITTATPAKAQQQKPAAQPTQAQFQQQIDELKKKLEETQQTATTAKLTNDFAKQAQAEAKDYYDKVLASESRSLWIMGIFITALSIIIAAFNAVLLAVAARIGFNTFERLTRSAIQETTTNLASAYNKALADETQKLKESNEANLQTLKEQLLRQMKTLDSQLQNRSDCMMATFGAFTLGQTSSYESALIMGRGAIQAYKNQRGTGDLTTENGIQVITIILLTLKAQHPTDFPAHLRIELQANYELFKGLDEEITGAMLEFAELHPVLQEWRSGKLKPIDQAHPQTQTG